jgi:hypothetical protein
MSSNGNSTITVPEGDLVLWDHESIPPGIEGADVLASLVDPHDERRRNKIAELQVKWMKVLTEDARRKFESLALLRPPA